MRDLGVSQEKGMDYRDLVFIAAAENLSFSKAAEEMFISQPAVTKHIAELERKWSISLFVRKGNKIYLSEAGKLAYTHLKEIKQSYSELEFELGRLNNTFKGRLRLGASSTISQYLIPSVISAFYKKYPKIEFFLISGNSHEIEEKLLDNEIDLALVENDSSQSNIKYISFQDDEIVVVTGSKSAYSKLQSISAKDLAEIPVVLREKGSGTLEVIQRKLHKNKINLDDLNIFLHLGSTEAIKNFLDDFDGIAIVSEKSIQKELRLGQITKLSIKGMSFHRKFRIAVRQGPLSFCSNLFIEFMLKHNK